MAGQIYWHQLDEELVRQIKDAFNGILTPDGTTITVNESGVISAIGGADSYVLPTASTTVLGGVKVDGATITIDANGVITSIVNAPIDIVNDLTTGGMDKALSAEQGKILKGLIDGIATYVLPVATTEILGGVKPDGTSITVDGDGRISSVMGDATKAILINPKTPEDTDYIDGLTFFQPSSLVKNGSDFQQLWIDYLSASFPEVQFSKLSHSIKVFTTLDYATGQGTGSFSRSGYQEILIADGVEQKVIMKFERYNINIRLAGSTWTIKQVPLFSNADKAKLDNIEPEANKYTLPIATDTVLGGVKQGQGVTIDGNGVISVSNEKPKTSKFTTTVAEATIVNGSESETVFVYKPSVPILSTDDLDVNYNTTSLKEGDWRIQDVEGEMVIILNVIQDANIAKNSVSGRIYRGFDTI